MKKNNFLKTHKKPNFYATRPSILLKNHTKSLKIALKNRHLKICNSVKKNLFVTIKLRNYAVIKINIVIKK
jgi:hypothetical protein